jgi:FAD/FMN-containing dehydrogenase
MCQTSLLRPQTFNETIVPLQGGQISRGLGRSYGDVAINPTLTLIGKDRNRILSFNDQTGDLTAQAGLSIAEILETFAPRGWFPPVTPGTKFVTLAGLVAVDAHGKNHHTAGSFGSHVNWIDLQCADGVQRRCSRTENTDLFNATLGGCGLTGHILTVSIRLLSIPSTFIVQRTLPASNLDAAMEIFEANHDATYSVAWIDCLATGPSRGRSLVLLGEHADPSDLQGPDAQNPFSLKKRKVRRMPIDLPSWAMNRHTIKLFNRLYYRAGSGKSDPQIVDYDSYFYPLDAIHDWNRLYGRHGFAQYQCAFPLDTSRRGLVSVLDEISSKGLGSFLAVLKRFGPGAPERPLSFPIEGYTLALDFALSGEAMTLMTTLDEIVCSNGGRLYLAKDSRMSQATFEAGYTDSLTTFRDLRANSGARYIFQSLLSKRLNL